MLDILKTKGTGGAFGHMTKALAVKVHRFELATAIVMLSDNMKLEKETIRSVLCQRPSHPDI